MELNAEQRLQLTLGALVHQVEKLTDIVKEQQKQITELNSVKKNKEKKTENES